MLAAAACDVIVCQDLGLCVGRLRTELYLCGIFAWGSLGSLGLTLHEVLCVAGWAA